MSKQEKPSDKDVLINKLQQENEALREELDKIKVARSDENVPPRDNLSRHIEFLKSLAQYAPLGVFAKDVKDDYRFIIWNKKLEQMFGVFQENILGKTDYDLWVEKEEADYYRQTDRQVMEGRKPLEIPEEVVSKCENPIIAHTIKIPIYDHEGQPAYLLGLLKDITEHQNTLRVLTQEQNRLQTLLNANPDLLVICDRDLKIIAANPAWCKWVGKREEELIGTASSDYLPPAIRGLSREKDEAVLTKGIRATYEFQGHDNETSRWYNVLKFPVFGHRGQVEGVFTTIRDTTDTKKAADEKHWIDIQIREAQKMESLGDMARSISRDFNNILMSIIGNADLALSDISNYSPVRENIMNIEDAARRASEMCREMMAYTAREHALVETTDLGVLIREMRHLLKLNVPRNTELKFHFADNLPLVKADHGQIRQCLINLINNACQAQGEKSGVIVISTGVRECDKQQLANTTLGQELEPGMYVSICVEDTGEGMSQEIQKRVFEPFYTTRPPARGLGLPAVMGIMRNHAGAISLCSKPGKGASFCLLFPISEAETGLPEKATIPEENRKQTGKILIVEDEESVRVIGKRMLQRAGYGVLLAANGLEALNIFEQNIQDIVCILLDLTMPVMGGVEGFHKFRKLSPEIPIIISTGFTEPEVDEKLPGEDISGYLQKPYTSRQLLAAIEKALQAPKPDA
ncbi:MAG: PAS domain-containing protein [Candidatus Sumerlaeia bacterium]